MLAALKMGYRGIDTSEMNRTGSKPLPFKLFSFYSVSTFQAGRVHCLLGT